MTPELPCGRSPLQMCSVFLTIDNLLLFIVVAVVS